MQGSEVKWLKADIGIDWDEGIVYGKIQDKKFESQFYTDEPLDSVNGLMIYNLRSATTSYFRDIKVETELP